MASAHLTFKNSDIHPMGCFHGCFSFHHKTRNRRRNSAGAKTKKKRSTEECFTKYVPLDSDASTTPEMEGNLLYDPLKEKPRGRSALKIKKRVRFDLEVKVYELVPEENDEIEDGATWEFISDEIGPTAGSALRPENRYGNCRDDYEEDEDILFDEDILDFDEIQESDEEIENREDLNINSVDEFTVDQISDQDSSRSPKLFRPSIRARTRDGKFAFDVLNPVENLSQWKAVKQQHHNSSV